jgi:LL-diaminopimelate aminotransferase
MALLNENYLKLQSSYLFSEIAIRVKQAESKNVGRKIIKLGIGDVTKPLPNSCLKALHKATDELANEATFRGYGPEQGYDFLREAIIKHDYNSRNVHTISADDIFVSDGSKCDSGNFQELFSLSNSIGVTDPVYPVYVDSNVMAGRTGSIIDGRYGNLQYINCSSENGFTPLPPNKSLDIVYLCSPNNPTGTVMDKELLTKWVEYALKHKAILLFDAAYYAFIRDEQLPQSIYEIPRAEEVAVEFRSYSKTAGFTGTRCAFTVVPKQCLVYDKSGTPHKLRDLWFRRQSTKFNGVSYPIQRAAEAIYSVEGQKEIKDLSDYYLENSRLILEAFSSAGLECYGGKHSPYVWVNAKRDSWEFFDKLLNEAQVVCTPGVGFGACGSGYVRFSAFGKRENVIEALSRIKDLF